MRAPNLPTAFADVVAGGALAGASIADPAVLLPALGSAALYAGGVALNDAFDVEKDRRLHPDRVLPSGLLSVRQAKGAGIVLLVAGVASGLSQGMAGLAVAAALGLSILAYDLLPESAGAIGPVLIGVCRGLNLWRGSFAVDVPPADVLAFAGLHCVLVFCVGAISLAEDRPGVGRLVRGAVGALPFLYVGPAVAAFRREESLLAIAVLVGCAELALWIVRPARRASADPTAVVPRAVFTLTLVGVLYCVAARMWLGAVVLAGAFALTPPLARRLGQRGS